MNCLLIMFIAFILLVNIVISASEETLNDYDNLIISCRRTDSECFHHQYRYLRELVSRGSQGLLVPQYRQYRFLYSDTGTCVKVTGVESSRLTGISFDGSKKLLSMTVATPIHLEQVPDNHTEPCLIPEREFTPKGPHTGPYNKFTCNATIEMKFPFSLRAREQHSYMGVESEELDVVLDVPDLSSYNKESNLETRIYLSSEWAYDMVKHVDVPAHVVVPFVQNLARVYNALPLNRFILLYPDEKYNELIFSYQGDK